MFNNAEPEEAEGAAVLLLDVAIEEEFRKCVGTEEDGIVDHVPVPLITIGELG